MMDEFSSLFSDFRLFYRPPEEGLLCHYYSIKDGKKKDEKNLKKKRKREKKLKKKEKGLRGWEKMKKKKRYK